MIKEYLNICYKVEGGKKEWSYLRHKLSPFKTDGILNDTFPILQKNSLEEEKSFHDRRENVWHTERYSNIECDFRENFKAQVWPPDPGAREHVHLKRAKTLWGIWNNRTELHCDFHKGLWSTNNELKSKTVIIVNLKN